MAVNILPDPRLADIRAMATDVFGSEADAEQWLQIPAFGLAHRRPADLLGTSEGIELVRDYLIRIQRGVYS